MSELNEKEMKLAGEMLNQYSDFLSNRCCNDFDFPDNWTDEEKTKFTKEYHDWNGDPEEYEKGNVLHTDFCVSMFLAYKLEKEGE